mgnify:CR=1 FL=1
MKSTDIKNHKTSISQTHNLEVPGSSPGWSTKKKADSQGNTAFFLYGRETHYRSRADKKTK